MRSQRRILLAFLLNLAFSVFEMIGGVVTGSVAILSDAVHDLSDAVSIGVSWLLERKSKKQPDEQYTYGYSRYSVVGSLITTCILLLGSGMVIYHAVGRIFCPTPIRYDGMILFAVIGVIVNAGAAFFTRGGESLNQKAVNLHMLEDVLGWVVVLVGAILMRFTDLAILDPILSIAVALYILLHAIGNLKEVMAVFLEKTPKGMTAGQLRAYVGAIQGVQDVHHIHLWSMDGQRHCATMHLVTDGDAHQIKHAVRNVLRAHGIGHVTLELESGDEHCHEQCCHVAALAETGHHHHHHHH